MGRTEQAAYLAGLEAENRRLRDQLRQVGKLAAKWANQPTDDDEDTEQQIADGNELLALVGTSPSTPTKETP